MKSNDSLKGMLHKLRYTTTPERRRETLENIYDALDESHKQTPATSRTGIGRLSMKTATGKLALAAAVILIVLGGVTFWPFGSANTGKWWLASPAALGQELLTVLDTIKAVTCREQMVFVSADGSEHTSSTWTRFYVSKDSYRRDIYDGNSLREIQWYIPDGNDMIQTGMRFDLKCYGAVRHKGSFGDVDPVERMRGCVGQMDKAQRLLEDRVIDGRDCVGFEIQTAGNGDNSENRTNRIWFDIETKLPMRIELSGLPVTGDLKRTLTLVQDQFDYDPQLPPDTFIPSEPPAGFVNAHPDELQQR
jgi:outer membrane lipoprotein-sorting protein